MNQLHGCMLDIRVSVVTKACEKYDQGFSVNGYFSSIQTYTKFLHNVLHENVTYKFFLFLLKNWF